MKCFLAKEFEMKDLSPMKYFLGMVVARSKKGISVSQRKYTPDLLKEIGFLGSKPTNTSIEANHKIGYEKGEVPINKGRYQRLVKCLIYLSHTRLDTAYIINIMSQFMHKPYEEHLEVVHWIRRYLKGTSEKGSFFRRNELRKIEAFTDMD